MENDTPRQSLKLEDLGSLLRLFQSEYFTMTMLMNYLKKFFDKKGIHDYLINKLYTIPYEELDFFIPQLCYLAVKKDSLELNNFLISKCAEHINLYLKISFHLNSFGQTTRNNAKQVDKITKLESYCEMAMVNGVNEFELSSLLTASSSEIEERVSLKFQEKELRSNYHNILLKFINGLIKLSLILKKIKECDQHNKLKEYIQKINILLSSNRKYKRDETKLKTLNQTLNFFEGIILPFSPIENFEYQSNLIVRVIENDFSYFNTRKRVPYKITVETIDVKDLEKFERKEEGVKKTASTADNLSESSNASANTNKMGILKSPKKKDPLTNEWEIIDDPIEEFDLFKIENIEEIAQNELNKYHGLTGFAKIIEENEKKTPNLLKHDKSLNHSNSLESELLMKKNDFNKMFPSKRIIQTISQEEIPHKNLIRTNSIQDLRKNDLKSMEIEQKIRKFGPWGEIWEDKEQLIKKNSPYGHFPSYKIRSIIVKGGDDLRQEVIAMQVISKLKKIFEIAKINVFLKPYEVIITSANSGIIEFIPNTVTIDHLKKLFLFDNKAPPSLFAIFLEVFGIHFEEAQKNFVESLASYSLICYLLNVKDRHNGNILIDSLGHIIHIDFGFMFSFSPGGVCFEKAPFKLTTEYVEVMGGFESNMYLYFKVLLMKMFIELKKHAEDFISIISIMMEDSNLPCFQKFDINNFRSKFLQNYTDQECMNYVEKLVEISLDNWRTIQYDNFQKMSNGILP